MTFAVISLLGGAAAAVAALPPAERAKMNVLGKAASA